MWLSVDLLMQYLLDFVVAYNRAGNEIGEFRFFNKSQERVDITLVYFLVKFNVSSL